MNVQLQQNFINATVILGFFALIQPFALFIAVQNNIFGPFLVHPFLFGHFIQPKYNIMNVIRTRVRDQKLKFGNVQGRRGTKALTADSYATMPAIKVATFMALIMATITWSTVYEK